MDKRKIFLPVLAFLLFCLLVSCAESAPDLTPIPRVGAVGVPESFPAPEDFFASIPEGASVRFAEGTNLSTLGKTKVTLILTTKTGKEYTYQSTFTLVWDNDPPLIAGVSDLSTGVGEGVAYRSGIVVTDDVDPAPVLSVDSSHVDLSRAGSYPVTYTATDFAGNKSSVTVTLHVYREATHGDAKTVANGDVLHEAVDHQRRAVGFDGGVDVSGEIEPAVVFVLGVKHDRLGIRAVLAVHHGALGVSRAFGGNIIHAGLDEKSRSGVLAHKSERGGKSRAVVCAGEE